MPNQPTEPAPATHHVFVDYENVQELNLDLIGNQSFQFTLLVGAKQTKIETPLVESLWRHAGSVHLVRLASPGRNALDFALAYYLGRAALACPTAQFHIVSKDKGYDALIEHLKAQGLRAQRHDHFAGPPFCAENKPPNVLLVPAKVVSTPANTSTPQPNQLDRVREHLRKLGKARPKRKKTLSSHLHASFKEATPELLWQWIEGLEREGSIQVGADESVIYRL